MDIANTPEYQAAYDQALCDVAAAFRATDGSGITLALIRSAMACGTLDGLIADWGSGEHNREYYLDAVASILRSYGNEDGRVITLELDK